MFHKKTLTILFMLVSIHSYSRVPFQNCVKLSGINNYITIPNPVYLDEWGQWTIDFWVKTDDATPGSLISRWSSDWEKTEWWKRSGWRIDLNRMGYVFSEESFLHVELDTIPGMISFEYVVTNEDGSGGGAGRSGMTTIEVGQWFHCVIRIDLMEIKMFVNDIEAGGTANSRATGYPLKIGGSPSMTGGGFTGNFQNDSTFCLHGSFDELRIWRGLRSWQNTSILYDTLSSNYYNTPDSGLVAYYRFDQLENLGVGDDNSTDDIRDLSVNANHADIVGVSMLTESTIEETNKATGIENFQSLPLSYDMVRNYPNPFNPSTTIRFELQSSQTVRLKVFNALGVELETLLDGTLPQGAHEVTWNAAALPAGIYFCRLETGSQSKTIKMLLQK